MLTPLHKTQAFLAIPLYRRRVQDVLVAEPEPGTGPSRRALVAAAVALLLLGAATVRRDGPPVPLQVRLASLDGSALRGESFVRLQVGLNIEGARQLDGARMLLAGTNALGLSPDGLSPDGLTDGEATVQVDLVPPCPQSLQAYVDAVLAVTLVDDAGESREVRLALPDDGPFERLVRFRCAG